jgi:hypothetical protein
MRKHRDIVAAIFCLVSAWVGPDLAAAEEAQKRLTPQEAEALPSLEAGTGTSGLAGIRTTVLSGNPNAAGLYTIRLVIRRTHPSRLIITAMTASRPWCRAFGTSAMATNAIPPHSRRFRRRASTPSRPAPRILPAPAINRPWWTSRGSGPAIQFTSSPPTSPNRPRRGTSGMILGLALARHCERSEAIQRLAESWIASSLTLLAMTTLSQLRIISL